MGEDENLSADGLRLDMVETLLRRGAMLDGGEIVQAIQFRHWPVVRLLFKYGAKLADKNNVGLTALEAILLSGRKTLIDKAFWRRRHGTAYDSGCLCMAVGTKNAPIVRHLLTVRPDHKLQDAEETTTIGLAAQKQDLNILRLLLTHLSSPTARVLPLRLYKEDGHLRQESFPSCTWQFPQF
ncbi:Fc.00g033390.m01.CDS01 [Cosmosporella sp. VM-42]